MDILVALLIVEATTVSCLTLPHDNSEDEAEFSMGQKIITKRGILEISSDC
jgi:hypothetical protein